MRNKNDCFYANKVRMSWNFIDLIYYYYKWIIKVESIRSFSQRTLRKRRRSTVMDFCFVQARSLNCSMRKASAFLLSTTNNSHSHRKSTRSIILILVRSFQWFSGHRQGNSIPRLYKWKDLPCPTSSFTPASQKDSKEERVTP